VLTEKAEYERCWGGIPVLGELLGNKRIPDHYYGPSSVSDNEFKRVQRLMKIYILIHENREEIKNMMRRSDLARPQLRRELEWVSKALGHAAQMFAHECEQVEQVARQ